MSGTYKSVLSTVVIDCNDVVLRPGDKTQTSVSASLSDDSFLDTKKAKVTYKSNKPSVATVDANGQVTAIGPGVASVFANVTIDGTITVVSNCNFTVTGFTYTSAVPET